MIKKVMEECFKWELKWSEMVTRYADLPSKAPDGQVRFVGNIGEAVVFKRGRWVLLATVEAEEGRRAVASVGEREESSSSARCGVIGEMVGEMDL